MNSIRWPLNPGLLGLVYKYAEVFEIIYLESLRHSLTKKLPESLTEKKIAEENKISRKYLL